jgi:hypothetical protein
MDGNFKLYICDKLKYRLVTYDKQIQILVKMGLQQRTNYVRRHMHVNVQLNR